MDQPAACRPPVRIASSTPPLRASRRRRRRAAAFALALALALALGGAPLLAQGTSFYTVVPCRVLDTLGAAGPLGAPSLAAGANRDFALGGQCGISTRAVAVSVNVTVVGPASAGSLSLVPSGANPNPTSTISFGPGQTRANDAVLGLGTAGAVTVLAGLAAGTVDLIVDVNGYFADPTLEQTTTAPPAFNPPPGSYTTATAVQLVSSTPGAQIFYTTDGSTPSSSHGTLYGGTAVSLTRSATLQAIATKAGLADSPITSGQYNLALAPTLLLASLTPQSAALSLGTGSASLLLAGNAASAVLHFTYSNLTGPIIAEHIHGSDTGIWFDIDTATPDATGGRLWTIVPVGTHSVADIVAALLAGQCYVNLHTATYPKGEIKGFLTVATGSRTFTPPPPPPALPPPPVTQTDAARFLMQASYGPVGPDEATTLATDPKGFDPWLADQLGKPLVSHLAYVDAARAAGEAISSNQVMESFWKQAITGPDQLRQRVALALSEIAVVSDVNDHLQPDGLANYLDILERDAFGNYRQLLADVTLDPTMGVYLNMQGNDKGDPTRGRNPNENYAREVMQLFSIGLYALNPDGTLQLDINGLPIPTYSQDMIKGLAQVFTGWTFAGGDHSHPGNFYSVRPNWRAPMESWPEHHTPGSKLLLGGTVLPAGQAPEQDLNAALDLIFNHPNVGPFICRELIQRLVTSNPSPAYVYRCGQAFANNGQGVRGDLQAVVRAILLDYEARSTTFPAQPGYGHLREPIVRLGGLLRALHATPPADGKFRIWRLENPEFALDQNPLRAPTVFNFFAPSDTLPGPVAQAGLAAPEFKITDETTVFGGANYLRLFIFRGLHYAPSLIVPDYSALVPLSDANLVADLNLVLMANGMSPAMQAALMTALANPSFSSRSDPTVRVKNLVWLIVLSPKFVVQK
ncbi:MAG TPA: DUF1800 family protein [Thermoanaerobaculia bacterium]|nr:DUF1800 family protein [Thermoanaerobaculia bacterium]